MKMIVLYTSDNISVRKQNHLKRYQIYLAGFKFLHVIKLYIVHLKVVFKDIELITKKQSHLKPSN